MLRLLIATTNPDKLREIRGILGRLAVETLTLQDVAPIAEPEETGATFAENARIKALYYDAMAGTGTVLKLRPYNDISPYDDIIRNVGTDAQVRPRPHYTVAEDSGLVIDALDGEPGVHSARFVRPDATYPERFAEIYKRLDQRPMRPRSARFVCAVAVAHKGTVLYETSGTVEGEIADIPRGEGGFGYDPIFYYVPFGRTLGEVTEEDKLRVAHRGEAFRRLAAWLEKR